MARLTGKIALITGGTTGIGRESARLFRDEGATVIVTGVNPGNVAAVQADLGVEALASDAGDLAAITALTAHIQARHGRAASARRWKRPTRRCSWHPTSRPT